MPGMTDGDDAGWRVDRVATRTGVVIPVRATARRPTWQQLPSVVRSLVEELAGAGVVSAESAGTGFTPGFASRLDLIDGRRVFVKAASSADDDLHGWPMSDAYREEVRKLSALPAAVGAPPVLWHRDVELAGLRWVVTGFQYVDGAPPRRPWRLDQLVLVLDKLAAVAEALTAVPPELGLKPLATELVDGYADRLTAVRSRAGDSKWLDTVAELCADAVELTAGASIVHLDLRDDNLLIDADGGVWIVDWNWPAVGARWVDLVCVLLSARGDGIDVDSLLAQHPLCQDVSAHSVDALLAVLWSFWAVAVDRPPPAHSPYLRHHQRWYLDVTEGWLRDRLDRR
jgi:aminoglycoside phosphotransferase (APT) family kinase protein